MRLFCRFYFILPFLRNSLIKSKLKVQTARLKAFFHNRTSCQYSRSFSVCRNGPIAKPSPTSAVWNSKTFLLFIIQLKFSENKNNFQKNMLFFFFWNVKWAVWHLLLFRSPSVATNVTRDKRDPWFEWNNVKKV